MQLTNLDKRTQKKMIQFSKIIVTVVTVCVTLLCGCGMWMCYRACDPAAVVNIVGHYMDFAMVAFAAYSINSISEKAIVNKVFQRRGLTETVETEESVG